MSNKIYESDLVCGFKVEVKDIFIETDGYDCDGSPKVYRELSHREAYRNGKLIATTEDSGKWRCGDLVMPDVLIYFDGDGTGAVYLGVSLGNAGNAGLESVKVMPFITANMTEFANCCGCMPGFYLVSSWG